MSTSTRTRSQNLPPSREQAHEAEATQGERLQHLLARVVSLNGPTMVLRTKGERSLHAQRAAGCLLEPAVGDTVACLCDGAGAHAWVVSVLERADAQAPHHVTVPGTLSLSVGRSSLTLSELSVTLKTPELHVAATQARATGEQVDVAYTRVHLFVQLLKTVGNTCSTVFDQVQHFAQRHLRTTQGLDRVQAHQLDLQAEQLLTLHAEHTLVDGEKLIKARGAQIHFG